MKKINLTQNKFAIVDDENYDYLSQWKWCMIGEYAARWKSKKNGEQKEGTSNILFMHRFLLDPKDTSLVVDHINGDKLDNRKDNLRIATKRQNSMNSKKRANTKFPYKGIVKRQGDRFQVMVWDGKNNLHVGCFETIIEAAKAYDKKAKELFGEFAKLNFPDK